MEAEINSPAAVGDDRPFMQFALACDKAVRSGVDERAILDEIGKLTQSFVKDWRMPDERFLACQPDSPYASYLLYRNSDASLSIVLDVFMPGQAAVIHNHRCWCAFTCLGGEERERLYRVPPDLSAAPLQTDERTCPVGNVRLLGSDRHLFHQVECASEEPTVSLHLYGADIGALVRDLWDANAEPDGRYVSFKSDYSNDAAGVPTYYS